MVDAWPVTLPQKMEVSGTSSGSADGRLRAKVDTGPAKVRRRTTASIRPLACRMICTDAQLADLRTFVDTTTAGGSLPFTFPPPEGGSDLLVRFDEQGLPTWTNISGPYWDVSFKLEVLP